MKRIHDRDISSIYIDNITDTVYKIYFREDIEQISNDKVVCNEYSIISENTTPDTTPTIEEFVNENKETLLTLAIEQDKIKANENAINSMKNGLNNTDYKVLKNLENFMIGIPFDKDLSEVCSTRQLIRDSINNIEMSDFISDEDLLHQAKQRSINEASLISQNMIINGVEFRGKNYRLNVTDQVNLSVLTAMAQMGRSVPYHADNEVCRILEPQEMLELSQTATIWIIYHNTYFNLLKHQILDYETIKDVNATYYGMPLKEEYQQIVDTIVNSAIGGDTND